MNKKYKFLILFCFLQSMYWAHFKIWIFLPLICDPVPSETSLWVFFSIYKTGLVSQNLMLFGHNCLFLLRRPKIELLQQMNNFSLWKKVVLLDQVVGQWQGRVRKLILQLSANELHSWYNIKRTSRLVKVKNWTWGQICKIWGGKRVFIVGHKLHRKLHSSYVSSTYNLWFYKILKRRLKLSAV